MEKKYYNVKAIVEGSITISLILVIMIMSIYMPIFSALGNFIVPIPITLLYLRHNWRISVLSVIISGVLLSLFYQPILGLTSAILFGITGITLGYCIKKDKKVINTILFLSIASCIGIIVNFLTYSVFIDKNGIIGFINENVNMFKESMNMAKDFYIKMGVKEENLEPVLQALKTFNADFIIKLLPALIIVLSIISAYISYSITRKILIKLGYNIKSVKSFTQIYINTRIGTLIVLFLILGIVLDRNNIVIGQYFLNSSQLIMQLAFLLNGIALLAYYLRNRFHLSKAMTVLILFFLSFSSMSIIVFYVGLVDIIFDFRKLDTYRKYK